MVKRSATRRRKMRGGGEVTFDLTWTVNNKPTDKIDVALEEQCGNKSTEGKCAVVDEVIDEAEARVVEAGYTNATLDDETFKSIKATYDDAKGKPTQSPTKLEYTTQNSRKPLKVTVTFSERASTAGKRRKTRGRRRH